MAMGVTEACEPLAGRLVPGDLCGAVVCTRLDEVPGGRSQVEVVDAAGGEPA